MTFFPLLFLAAGANASSHFHDGRLDAALGPLAAQGIHVQLVRADEGTLFNDGYRVKADSMTATITAGSPRGAYYGILDLKRHLAKGRGPTNWSRTPEFAWRGVLEGFYGIPWTWESRQKFVRWLPTQRLNIFVLASKDDAVQRAEWRRPFTPSEAAELAALAKIAKASFVDLAWELSPGLDAKLEDPGDVDAAVKKLESVIQLGVKGVVVAFDDTDAGPAAVDFADKVLRRIKASHPAVSRTFVPAEYSGAGRPTPYLRRIAERMDPSVLIGWTGPQIISRTIGPADAWSYAATVGHALVLGDNYPVQDRLVDRGRLFLGPLTGRGKSLSIAHVQAYLANASPLVEVSKASLSTVAEFAWNPAAYDPSAALHRAALELGGPAAPALEFLMRENSASWLSAGSDGGLAAALDLSWENRRAAPLRRALQACVRIDADLARLPNHDLRRELRPWSTAQSVQCGRALAALAALEARRAGTRVKTLPAPDLDGAVVSDLALDRFLSRARAELAGTSAPETRDVRRLIDAYCAARSGLGAAALRRALARMVQSPTALHAAVGRENARLFPVLVALAAAARRADRSFSHRSVRLPLADVVDRWRGRLAFIPLLAARPMLEHFLDEHESSVAPVPAAARIWLWLERHRHPDSLLARLSDQLALPPERRDTVRLKKDLATLADLPRQARAAMGAALPEEALPWFDKIGQYGALGLRALELENFTAQDRTSWRLQRESLRSGNGLEVALEAALSLEALARWNRLPPARRPERLDVPIPSDPAQAF